MNKTLVTLIFAINLLFSSLIHADLPPNFTELVEKASPAVVSIEVQSLVTQPKFSRLTPPFPDLFEHFFGEQGSPFSEPFPEEQPEKELRKGNGSGFIIDAEGYVLTNAHVIDGADSVSVLLTDQREYSAEIVGVDKRTDIALLKIAAQKLPTVQLGDSDAVKVGDWVLAIGSPFGFDTTATKGIVSALGRSLPSGTYTPFIQTDAAINPGNSGGPLFNGKGEVIGITSQIYTRSGAFNGVGFAIPINLAKTIAEQLKTTGSVNRGWLGVSIQAVDQKLAESFGMEKPEGALIAQIVKDAPAEKAQLKVGDILLSFNGHTINKASDLPPLVAMAPLGKDVEIEYLRDGKKQTTTVKIENLETADTSSAATSREMRNWGIELKALGDDTRNALEYEDKEGVLIARVEPNSAAAKSGLRAGDILIAVGDSIINTPKEASKLLAKTDRALPVLIYRRGSTIFLPLMPEKKK